MSHPAMEMIDDIFIVCNDRKIESLSREFSDQMLLNP